MFLRLAAAVSLLVAVAACAPMVTSAPATLRLTRAAPPAAPKSMKLRVRVSSSLRKRRITLRGSVAAGATNRIDVELIGKTPKGRRVTSKQRITVPASGTFTKRLKPPAKASVRRPVQLVLTLLGAVLPFGVAAAVVLVPVVAWLRRRRPVAVATTQTPPAAPSA